jgi:FdhD protein
MDERRPLLQPDPQDPRLTELVHGIDHTGAPVETRVTVERALTLYLNAQEIVTMMTINDYPEYLAIGYLLNQNMLKPGDEITGVDYDDDLQVVVVRTKEGTNFEQKAEEEDAHLGLRAGHRVRRPDGGAGRRAVA